MTTSEVSPTIVEISAPEGVTDGVVSATGADLSEVSVVASGPTARLVGLVAGGDYTISWSQGGTVVGTASHRISQPPTNLPTVQVDASADQSLAGGVLVTTIIQPDGGWLVALDSEGRYVFWFDVGHRGATHPDFPGWDGAAMPITGRLIGGHLLVAAYDSSQSQDVGRLWRIPIDAMTAEEVDVTRTEWAHHDWVWHQDEGRLAWLGYDFDTANGVRWASDRILEAPQEGGAFQERWSFFDDYAPEVGGVTPISPESEGFSVPALAGWEWTHSNSLMYDADSDDYFVLSKFHDALIRVNRSSGSTEWTLGGPNSDFRHGDGGDVWRDPYDTDLWSHAHMSDLWVDPGGASGGFVVFDNGYHYVNPSNSQGWSHVSEYRFDEASMTVEKVWEFAHPDGRFTPLMGDARKLSDDRYLVGWSSLACVEEITANGQSVWEACLPLGQIMGRASWNAGWGL